MNRQDIVRSPEALIKAVGHDQAQHRSKDLSAIEPLPAITVAISRETGALGTMVATEVGARLSWPVYDHALLERMAEEMHVHVDLLESIDERHVPWLVERMEAFSAVPYVSENTYVRRLIETILSLGARGNCLIVGRGSVLVLPPTTTLRVRLVADFNDRVLAIMREMTLTSTEATRRVKALDQERTAFVKDHFHTDVASPDNYDLLLNTSRLTVAGCADVIVAAVRVRERERARLLSELNP